MANDTRPRQFLRTPLAAGGIAFAATVAVCLSALKLGVSTAVVTVFVFAVAALVVRLWARANVYGRLGLTALAAVAAVVEGIRLGTRTYDERYIYDNRTPLWETLNVVGFLLSFVGVAVLIGCALSAVVVWIVRLFRPPSVADDPASYRDLHALMGDEDDD